MTSDEGPGPVTGTDNTTTSMTRNTVHIEQLFNTTWIRRGDEKERLGSWALVLYAPFGLLLFLIRLGILIQFFLLKLILPDSGVKRTGLRMMGGMLGVSVSTEGEISTTANTFVANHITILDSFIIHSVTDALFVIDDATEIPECLHETLGITKENRRCSPPIIYFPEEETTNGVAGLLGFKDLPPYPPSVDGVIQPIAIKVTRPFLNVNSIHGGFKTELFFTLFSINTHYTLKFLNAGPWDRMGVQKSIASSLKIQPTNFVRSDKEELLKKLNFRPLSMAAMARIVQQQLYPVVLSPDSVISAIQKTGSVDEALQELRKSIAQPSFRKNATERMSTFQERKRLMVQAARDKYLETHAPTTTNE